MADLAFDNGLVAAVAELRRVYSVLEGGWLEPGRSRFSECVGFLEKAVGPGLDPSEVHAMRVRVEDIDGLMTIDFNSHLFAEADGVLQQCTAELFGFPRLKHFELMSAEEMLHVVVEGSAERLCRRAARIVATHRLGLIKGAYLALTPAEGELEETLMAEAPALRDEVRFAKSVASRARHASESGERLRLSDFDDMPRPSLGLLAFIAAR